MSKQPAFLLYHQDFYSGVSDMTNEEIGAYMLCLLVQASKGGITEKHMFIISKRQEVYDVVKTKFVLNIESGLLENIRLKNETTKRKNYAESRSANRKGKTKTPKPKETPPKSHENHMDNDNEDTMYIVNKHEDFKKICLSDEVWKNTLIEKNILTLKFIEPALKSYNSHLIQQGQSKPDLKEYKSHFINWVKKKQEIKDKEKNNGRI